MYSLATKTSKAPLFYIVQIYNFVKQPPPNKTPMKFSKKPSKKASPPQKKCYKKIQNFNPHHKNSLQNPYQPQTLQRSLKRTPRRLLKEPLMNLPVPQASIWIKIKAEKSQIKFSFSSYLLNNRSTKNFANTRYLNFGVLESYTSLEKGFLFIFQNQVRRNGYQN